MLVGPVSRPGVLDPLVPLVAKLRVDPDASDRRCCNRARSGDRQRAKRAGLSGEFKLKRERAPRVVLASTSDFSLSLARARKPGLLRRAWELGSLRPVSSGRGFSPGKNISGGCSAKGIAGKLHCFNCARSRVVNRAQRAGRAARRQETGGGRQQTGVRSQDAGDRIRKAGSGHGSEVMGRSRSELFVPFCGYTQTAR